MKSCDRLEIKSAAYFRINIFFIEDRKQNLENTHKEAECNDVDAEAEV